MTKRRLTAAACIVAMLSQLPTGPVLAEQAAADENSSEDEGDSESATEGEADRQTATQALGISRQDGKTTLGQDSGNFEATLLAHAMLNTAAVQIRTQLQSVPTGEATRVILLSGRNRTDLSARHQIDTEFVRIDTLLRLAEARCAKVEAETADRNSNQSGAVSAAAIDILKAAIDLFSHSTAIAPLAVTLEEAPMRNALMAERLRPGLAWVSPDEQLGPHPVQQRLSEIIGKGASFAGRSCEGDGELEERLAEVRDALTELGPPSAEPDPEEEEEEEAEDGESATDDARDDAPTAGLLARALATPPFDLNGALVMRVNLSGTGGSQVVRSNFLTLVGAEAAFVNSGFAVDYSLVEPRTGVVVGSGVITCMSPTIPIRRFRRPTAGCQ